MSHVTMIRLISAIALMPLVLIAVWMGGIAYQLLILGAALVALYEWMRMVHGQKIHWNLVGGAFLFIAFACLLWLRNLPDGRNLVLFLFCVTWGSDSGAYFGGRRFGGPKLAPSISPNKTVSGAIAGLVTAFVVGLVFWLSFPYSFSIVIIAVLVAVFVALGDLLESYCKRYFGVKDSGQIIPGHGGMLDRIDGLLLAAPAFVILYQLFM